MIADNEPSIDPATRTTNEKTADQLFKAGRRILAGEDPLKVFPKGLVDVAMHAANGSEAKSDAERLSEIEKELKARAITAFIPAMEGIERRMAHLAMEAFQIRLKEIFISDSDEEEGEIIFHVRHRLELAEKVIFLSRARRDLARNLVKVVESGALDDSLEPEWKEREETQKFRDRLVADIYSLGKYDLKVLIAAVDVVKHHDGFTSPAEDFLRSLLAGFAYCPNDLLPETVDSFLQEYRENLDVTAKIARHFAKTFPSLMADQRATEPAEPVEKA